MGQTLASTNRPLSPRLCGQRASLRAFDLGASSISIPWRHRAKITVLFLHFVWSTLVRTENSFFIILHYVHTTHYTLPLPLTFILPPPLTFILPLPLTLILTLTSSPSLSQPACAEPFQLRAAVQPTRPKLPPLSLFAATQWLHCGRTGLGDAD